MSEIITEMIVPGTYIEVRPEGLIGVGGINTSTIGIFGTACKGPLNTAITLSSFLEVLDIFGEYDEWINGNSNELTLVRALEQIYKNNGTATVIAVRVGNDEPTGTTGTNSAYFELKSGIEESESTCVRLEANTKGSWGNHIKISVSGAEEGTNIGGEFIDKNDLVDVVLSYKNVYEKYTVRNGEDLKNLVNKSSKLVKSDSANSSQPNPINTQTFKDGRDGENIDIQEYKIGLQKLEEEPVNIVLAAGIDFSSIYSLLIDHCEKTENLNHERIALVGGGSSDTYDDYLDYSDIISDDRIILVAPGIQCNGNNGKLDLPSSYTAAVVAGKLSSLAVHISPTNKTLAIDGLIENYNYAKLKQLVDKRILVINKNLGFRIVKGITTDTSAFKQITVRRIVDFAKEGIRRGCQPYIGLLNNSRVRAALRATMDGFLSQMVVDEQLTEYALKVEATREEERNGICRVEVLLKPTFSIDFIKVIMTLQ